MSYPEKALTNKIKVNSGVLKFVKSLSTHLNLYPGIIKIEVLWAPCCNFPFSFTEPPDQADSSVLTEVVPTASTVRPSTFALFTLFAFSSLT